MRFLRILPLGMMEMLINQGLALGFAFAVIILLRPVTNRLLRPKYRVVFWLAGWMVGWGSFYRTADYIRVLPVTFRGWITPEVQTRDGIPAYFPTLDQAGVYSFSLPGGIQIPFSVSEGMLNVLALLVTVGFVVVIWWGCREENVLRRLSRQGDPMDAEWHRERGIDPDAVRVRILPNLPASFVCRISPGVHYVCLQKELPPEQMELVLRHELAHVKGSHVWGKGIVMALMLLYWWNPVMWVAYRLVSRDIELACDEAVLNQLTGDERRTYARMLVELGSGKHLWGGLTCFGECDAEIRVRNAVKWKPELRWTGVLIWPVLVLAFLFFFTSPADAAKDREELIDTYLHSERLVKEVGRFADDPELEVRELWRRDETLLVLDGKGRWHLSSIKFGEGGSFCYLGSYTKLREIPSKYQFEQVDIHRKEHVRGWSGDCTVWEDYVSSPTLILELQDFMEHPIEIVQIFEHREGEILILVEDDYWPYWKCKFEQTASNHNNWHPRQAERLEREEFDVTGLRYIKPWSWYQ